MEVALKVIIFITLLNCRSPVIVLRIDSVVNKNIYGLSLLRRAEHMYLQGIDNFRKKNRPERVLGN